MCPSAPRVCSEPGGQKPVLSLSLDPIHIMYITQHTYRVTMTKQIIFKGSGVVVNPLAPLLSMDLFYHTKGWPQVDVFS